MYEVRVASAVEEGEQRAKKVKRLNLRFKVGPWGDHMGITWGSHGDHLGIIWGSFGDLWAVG
jgi:hypothetical protein